MNNNVALHTYQMAEKNHAERIRIETAWSFRRLYKSPEQSSFIRQILWLEIGNSYGYWYSMLNENMYKGIQLGLWL